MAVTVATFTIECDPDPNSDRISDIGGSGIKRATPTRSNLDRATDLWVESLMLSERLEKGVLPENHHIVKELNSFTSALRHAVNNDPLLRRRGIALDPEFKAIVLTSLEENAWVNPRNEKEVYFTTGFINRLGTVHRVVAFGNHEHNHLVAEALSRQPDPMPPPTERFGEKIWRDPLIAMLAEEWPEMAAKKLFSIRNELYCDTRFDPLNAVGVDPRKMASALYRILESHDFDPYDLTSQSRGWMHLKGAFESHPPTPHRIWVAQTLADQASYPESLGGDSNDREVEHLSSAAKIKEIANILAKHTKLLERYVVGKFDSPRERDDFVYLPDSEGRFISSKLTDLLRRADPATRLETLFAIAEVMEQGALGGQIEPVRVKNTVLSAAEFEVANKIFKVLDQKTPIKGEGNYSTRARTLTYAWHDHIEHQVSELFSSLNLNILERIIFDSKITPDVDQRNKAEKKLEREIKNLSPEDVLNFNQYITPLGISFLDLWHELSQICEGRSFRYGMLTGTEDGSDDAAELSLMGEESLISMQGFFPTESRDPITNKYRKAVERFVEIFLKVSLEEGHFIDAKSALGWLCQLKEEQSTKVYFFGPGVTEDFIFEQALYVIHHFTSKGESVSELFKLVSSLGIESGMTYPDLKYSRFSFSPDVPTSGEYGGDKESELFALLVSNKDVTKLIKEISLYNPTFADRLITRLAGYLYDEFHLRDQRQSRSYAHDDSRRDTDQTIMARTFRSTVLQNPSYAKMSLEEKSVLLRDILNCLHEPDQLLVALKGSELKNLHDLWAFNAIEAKRSNEVRQELQRGDDALSSYLDRLSTVPHRFTSVVWERIAEEAIRDLKDLELVVDFINREYTTSMQESFPALERNRVESIRTVIEISLKKLEELEVNDVACTERLYRLLTCIPRTARRNAAVLAVIEKLASVTDVATCGRFAELVETEPFWDMMAQNVEELKAQGDKRLREFELRLPLIPKALVPVRVLEAELPKRKLIELLSEGALDYNEWIKSGKQLPDDKVVVFDLTHPWMEELKWPPLDGLPPVCEPSALRYHALKLIQQEGGTPLAPLQFKTKALREAEAIAPRNLKRLGIDDPLKVNPFAEDKVSAAELFRWKEKILDFAQPRPTPLKDSWIIDLIDKYERSGAQLSLTDLKRLRSELYLPENIELLGVKMWDVYKAGPPPNHSPHEILDAVEEYLPYYSVRRNAILSEASTLLGERTLEFARHLELLRYVPGMPLPLPNKRALATSSAVEFQIKALESFEDFDIVEFVLYSYGILPDKPFSTQYIERILGRGLDGLRDLNQELDPGARRELLHRLFGGSSGILARNDRLALTCLSNRISEKAGTILGANVNTLDLIKAVSTTVLIDGGFPIHTRTEVLAVLSEWLEHVQGRKVDTRDEAGLVKALFSALGSPGDKLLQNLVIRSDRFPAAWVPTLRGVQYKNNPGHACLPFFSAKAHAVEELCLGRCRAVGSMGEIWELKRANGVEYEGVLLKVLRGDTLAGSRALSAPMEKVASTLRRHKQPWGENVIGAAVDACYHEAREMIAERERTGKPIGRVIQKVLEGKLRSVKDGVTITPPSGSSKMQVVLPRPVEIGATPLAGDGFCHIFAVTDLGPDFHVMAEYEEKRGEIPLEQVMAAKGVNLSVAAGQIWEIFFVAFLEQGVLFKDLSFGNVGIREGKNPELALVDFGGVIDEFPERWREWVIRLAGTLALKDLDGTKSLLLEAWREASEGEEPDGEVLVHLEQLFAHINTSQSALSNMSLAGGLDDFAKITSFLYEHWNVPKEVRDFCEALRKVQDEWGKFVSADATAALAGRLTPALMEVLLTPQTSKIEEAAAQTEEEVEAALPERDIERVFKLAKRLSHDSANQAAFTTGKLPAGALLWVKSGEQWKSFTGVEEQPWPAKKFKAERDVTISRYSEAFVEIQEGELSYYQVVRELSR